ncbi:ABC transporter permease [Parafrigoribacterium soli]|uniref:ABC transporter permease n=1 Tax=Parafrigoribacterium soli TaxID=3144663 RepID=UPI0032EAB5C9
MTTMTSAHTAVPEARTKANRVWNAARLQFTNGWQSIGLPWLVLAIIFFAYLAIWVILYTSTSGQDRKDLSDGLQYSGATWYIFVYMLVVAIQAIARTFPFALGLSVTRRDFYLGTSLAFVIFSVIYGCGLTLLSYLEDWTGGWGVGGRMFTAVYYGSGPFWQRLFIFVSIFLFFFFVGMASATLYVRWKATGLLSFGAVLLALGVGLIALATWSHSWERVGEWFATSGSVGVVAWMLAPTVLAAVVGYFVLRRATPKN